MPRKCLKCLLNCKGEGPPGPVWCRICGHDPACCICEDDPDHNPQESHATTAEATTTDGPDDHEEYDPELAVQ